VNRTPVKGRNQYFEILDEARKGNRVLFLITRDGNSMFLVVTLEN
jgi:S1-C subfamily serine protease